MPNITFLCVQLKVVHNYVFAYIECKRSLIVVLTESAQNLVIGAVKNS